MGLFNFFKTSIVLSAVNRAEKGIKNSNSYKYFAKDDTPMIKEYKDFECGLIASAITVLALDMDLNNPNQKKEIQTVYIGKCSSFLKKIISKTYKCQSIKLSNRSDNNLVEKLLVLETHTRFNQYLEDIKNAFNQKSAFYFWEYDQTQINELTGEEVFGEERLFDFVWNLLLARESLDWDEPVESYIIDYNNFLTLKESEVNLLNSFVYELKLLLTK